MYDGKPSYFSGKILMRHFWCWLAVYTALDVYEAVYGNPALNGPASWPWWWTVFSTLLVAAGGAFFSFLATYPLYAWVRMGMARGDSFHMAVWNVLKWTPLAIPAGILWLLKGYIVSAAMFYPIHYLFGDAGWYVLLAVTMPLGLLAHRLASKRHNSLRTIDMDAKRLN